MIWNIIIKYKKIFFVVAASALFLGDAFFAHGVTTQKPIIGEFVSWGFASDSETFSSEPVSSRRCGFWGAGTGAENHGTYTPSGSGWTGFQGTSNQILCMETYLASSQVSDYNQDFQFCIQIADQGIAGNARCTPWASDGGGWSDTACDDIVAGSNDQSCFQPDQSRVGIKTRLLPSNKAITDVQAGLQLASDRCVTWGSARYTPWATAGGGWSGGAHVEVLDDPGRFAWNVGCARIYLGSQFETIVSPTPTPTPPAPTPLPDLVVRNLNTSPLEPVQGQDISFNGTVKNIDIGSASASKTRLRVDFNKDGSWDISPAKGNVALNDTAPLGSGASEVEQWTITGAANIPIGTHLFEICADVKSNVSESNEGNNCNTKEFIVKEPPVITPTVPTTTCTPTAPSTPTLLSPSNGATNQPTSLTLDWFTPSWIWGESCLPGGNQNAFVVYFDHNNSTPSTKLGSTGNTGWPVSNLAQNAQYYWKIKATNGGPLSTDSATWMFKTAPPGATPQAPSSAVTHTECQNNACVSVSGSGANQCSDNSNCAPPPPPPPRPTASISANPTSIAYNTASTINWSSSNTETCTVSPNNWTGTGGSRPTGNLTSSQIYTVNCSRAGVWASDSVTVNVGGAPTASISGTATTINYGDSSTLNWSSTNTNADGCSINQGIGGVGTSGSRSVSPTTSTTYTLTCSGPGASALSSVTISVLPGGFTLSLGGSVACNFVPLSWTSSGGAAAYKILKGNTKTDISPYQPYTALNFTDYAVSENSGYEYQIEAYNSAGATRSNTISGTTPYCPPTLNFSGNPTTVFEGQSSTLTWSTTYVNPNSCTASGAWSGTKAANGSVTVVPLPPPSVTYNLQCSGNGGTTPVQPVTITVRPLALPEWRETIPR